MVLLDCPSIKKDAEPFGSPAAIAGNHDMPPAVGGEERDDRSRCDGIFRPGTGPTDLHLAVENAEFKAAVRGADSDEGGFSEGSGSEFEPERNGKRGGLVLDSMFVEREVVLFVEEKSLAVHAIFRDEVGASFLDGAVGGEVGELAAFEVVRSNQAVDLGNIPFVGEPILISLEAGRSS